MSAEKSNRESSFKGKGPGFLVAKGRFVAPSESDLKRLMSEDGVKTNDSRIPELKNKIDHERHVLEKKHVKDLSSAIMMAILNNGSASIRCIGKDATYNAVKAMSIAHSNCLPKGIELVFTTSFTHGNLGNLRNDHHVSDVTAIVFSVESRSSKPSELKQE